MVPKKRVEATKPKRKNERATIEVKKKLIAKHESGVRLSDLSTMFKMPKSTICTILKRKEVIKAADVAKGVTILTSSKRPQAMEQMEKLLLVWINEKQMVGDNISEAIICEKAKQLFGDIKQNAPGSHSEGEFKASRGWFDNFKKRAGIHNVVRHGETVCANKAAGKDFVKKFKTLVEIEGFVSQQVFNCNEAGLFWKKMPKRTCISTEGNVMLGHKSMEDRLTLLLCGNASGDCKVKPLLVYHTNNQQLFSKNNVIKSKSSFVWRTNKKAWITKQFFKEWIHEEFIPCVKAYLEEKNLSLKALLLMGSAPAHPPSMAEELVDKYSFLKVMFFPSSTTLLIQPIDQVLSNFKKLYIKEMFQRCFEATNDTKLTLRDFWKDYYNIVHCLRTIDKAWRSVSLRTMNSAWKKLWPDCVTDRDSEDFESVLLVNDIISLGKSLGLELSDDDVEELVEDHKMDLTTEELQHIYEMQTQEGIKEISSEEEKESKETISTAEIKELFFHWSKAQAVVKKWHPDTAVTNRSISLFRDNVMDYFLKIHKSPQYQTKLERHSSIEKKPSEPLPSTSGASDKQARGEEEHQMNCCLLGLWKGIHFPSSGSSLHPLLPSQLPLEPSPLLTKVNGFVNIFY